MDNFKFLFLIIILFLSSCISKEIKENKGIAVAQIIGKGVKYYKGEDYHLKYSFFVNNKQYIGEHTSYIQSNNISFFIDKYFPVVYSTKNPEKSILLVTPTDFESWGMPFPDSLNWVENKLGF